MDLLELQCCHLARKTSNNTAHFPGPQTVPLRPSSATLGQSIVLAEAAHCASPAQVSVAIHFGAAAREAHTWIGSRANVEASVAIDGRPEEIAAIEGGNRPVVRHCDRYQIPVPRGASRTVRQQNPGDMSERYVIFKMRPI